MGTKQKPVKTTDSSLGSGIVVFRTSRWDGSWIAKKWRAIHPELKVSIIALGLIAAVVVAYLSFHNPPQRLTVPLPPNMDTDYTSTDVKNFPILLDHDYGLTEDDVLHGNLHKELKSFQEAYDIAIVAARLGHKQQSLEAYKIAVSKAPKNIDVSFYTEVMGVSYHDGDKQYAEQMYQKAVAIVQNSTPPPAGAAGPVDDGGPMTKQEELQHLQDLYDILKQGADS